VPLSLDRPSQHHPCIRHTSLSLYADEQRHNTFNSWVCYPARVVCVLTALYAVCPYPAGCFVPVCA
jgi:hypothetical protein